MIQSTALKIMQSGKNVFLTGEPGAGKTYLINQFVEWAHKHGKRVAVTASTGIAATHLNGKTIHSFCAMGIKEEITKTDLMLIQQKKYAVEDMKGCDILIIDEISMLSAQTLDNVDKILTFLRSFMSNAAFGGLQIILVGDFFQLPPVKGEFAFLSEAWENAEFNICYLTEQHRQHDAIFTEVLNSIRNGEVKQGHKDILWNKVLFEKPVTRLFTKNKDVDHINREELAKIKGKEKTYTMESGGVPFLVELLKKNCMSPDILTLRVGAKVMFTRNNFEVGYVNGTMGEVIGYSAEGMPMIKTVGGSVITAKYEEWSIDDTKAWISQLPLRLAWAITVHKSQGMSLDGATMDLSECFEYGQGYVALSRVRTINSLYLEGINDRAFEVHPTVVEKDREFRKASELLC